jgi:hypothetical protein
MKIFHPVFSTFIAAAGLLGLPAILSAQIALSTAGTYTQSFDTLPVSGTIVWTNNVTLPGWYAQRAVGPLEIVASTGSSTGGAFYNFGAAFSSERALGSLGSGTTGSVAWGVIFQNTSVNALVFTDFNYAGELWRRGATGKIDTLEFDYRLGLMAATDLLAATGWTAANALDFSNPNTAGGTSALDGNNAANRTLLSATLNLTLAPGQFVTFRWLDVDHSGADNGLAIDNVAISITAPAPVGVVTAVPEPATSGWAVAAVLTTSIILRRRRIET